MNKNVEPTTRGDFEFFDCKPPSTDMLTEVVHGLTANNKRLPPKYFYDEMGSALFDAITRLPEYYLTRTELGLFDAYGGEMGEEAGNVASVVEYGSGSSIKIRKLLESVDPQAYAPVDISSDHLRVSARQLHDDYPWLHVYPICADYTEVFALPEPIRQHSKLGFFPGSSIGNFEPEDVVRFLVNVRETLGQGSEFIVGVDLEKPRDVLDAAMEAFQLGQGFGGQSWFRCLQKKLGAIEEAVQLVPALREGLAHEMGDLEGDLFGVAFEVGQGVAENVDSLRDRSAAPMALSLADNGELFRDVGVVVVVALCGRFEGERVGLNEGHNGGQRPAWWD